MARPRCYVDSPDTLQNVLKVLDLILMNLCTTKRKKQFKPVQDVYSSTAQDQVRYYNRGKTVGKNCVKLLNKSLCSHRYETAIKVLQIVCQDSTVFGSFIFKASMFIFDNLNFPNKAEVMWNFLRIAQKLDCINRTEIQLEYIIYGMQNNIPDLQKRATEIFTKTKIKNGTVDPICEAYSSFLQYAECFGNLDEIQPSQAKLTAENAIVQFKNIVTSPGNWDVFVLKLVKMLDFCDRSYEIEDVLLKYVECNPDNLNAHIYLCVYLYNYSPDSEKITQHLEILAKLCPSDIRVLLLLEKWSNLIEPKIKECLKLSFMFLDYPSNEKNVQAWQLLSHFLCLTKLRNCDDELKKIRSLWKARCKCWHWLYFHPSQIPYLKECDYLLTEIKINVLSYLDADHEYIQEALEKFPTLKLPY